MKVFGVIYLIINGVNDKEYVGQTTKNVKARFKQHARRKNSLIGNAIRAYGEDMFVIAILKVCYSKEELDFWEKHFIKSRNTMSPDGYNLTEGGEGIVGYVDTDEQRAQKSLRQLGEKNHAFGKPHTAEHNAKIAASMLGEKNPFFGKHHTEETKAIIRAKNSGIKLSPERCLKMAELERGETHFQNFLNAMIERQLTYRELSRKFDMPHSTIARKMNGKLNFTEKDVERFVELFGLPAEYLFERDDGLPVKISKNYYQTLYKNLSDTMTAKQISYTELAKLLKVSQSAISMKMTGKRNFTDKDIAKLEEIFDLPAKYLMARTDK